MSRMSGGKGFLLGALIGTVVGGVTALLLAPKSGEKLRKDLAKTADDLSDKTRRMVNSMNGHAVDLAEKAKEIAEDVRSSAEEFLDEFRKR